MRLRVKVCVTLQMRESWQPWQNLHKYINTEFTLAQVWYSPSTTMAFIQFYLDEWAVCEALMFTICAMTVKHTDA